MNQLYTVIGMSKQAVSQYAYRQRKFDGKVQVLLSEAEDLRKEHPGCGVEKMYYSLRPDFIGRDRFIELFMSLGFRLKKQKNYKRTTYAVASNYPNLIKGMCISSPCTVWQSDITYIAIGDRFYYAVFIIDAYTKKIVGFCVSDHLRATANMQALTAALKENSAPQVHHSDKGSQYIYKDYVSLLKEKGCRISMAQSAQDNAYAERINRTIKEEYIDYWQPQSFEQLRKCINRAVKHYNNQRPHNGISRHAPVDFEYKWRNGQLKPKPVLTIFDNEILF